MGFDRVETDKIAKNKGGQIIWDTQYMISSVYIMINV